MEQFLSFCSTFQLEDPFLCHRGTPTFQFDVLSHKLQLVRRRQTCDSEREIPDLRLSSGRSFLSFERRGSFRSIRLLAVRHGALPSPDRSVGWRLFVLLLLLFFIRLVVIQIDSPFTCVLITIHGLQCT